jgi:hypothetical protein
MCAEAAIPQARLPGADAEAAGGEFHAATAGQSPERWDARDQRRGVRAGDRGGTDQRAEDGGPGKAVVGLAGCQHPRGGEAGD